ncbi:hypothetical protein [Syntrophotalea acetylenica]|uniref:hypothetical protein n=1 Tax=Syntrophotalea acetylenica TaxID=29542 RepID=UPI002A362064|nr:hypothetical protein [Syntrophotalea acetylenica]MDY0261977.1 hypothetical protein [Syntrophotalea acetylenica]
MSAAAEKHLKLVISAYTKGAETGLKNIQGEFSRLRSDVPGVAKALEAASRALDVRTMRSVNHEVAELRKQYALLRDKGVLSQKELAQAAGNLKAKTAALRAEYDQANRTQQQGIATTANLTGHVKKLVAAYLGYRTITAVIGGMVTAARTAEQSQFNLATSVEAANREFDNVGSIDHWKGKVGEMAAALKIYSESEVAGAIARTVDMTKRLGLSAAQMEELTLRAADLGAGKTDLEGSIERVTAALRGEAESAEFLGLTLNETYVASWHAAHNAHGRAWKDLTDLEKAQVRYQVLLEQSAGVQGKAAASAGTLGGALQQIKSQVSDAIANNKDFNAAMTTLAATIRDNADEIGEWAADLATGIGKVVEFVAENKTLILTLVGAGGTLIAVNATAKGIRNVAVAIDTLRKAKLAGLAVEAAGGLGQMGVAAGSARTGIAALTTGMGPHVALIIAGTAAIVATVQAYLSWRDAAGEAEMAHDRLMAGVDDTIQKFAKYKDFRLPGLDGKTVEDLQAIQKELAGTHNYWTNYVIKLQDAKDQAAAAFGPMSDEVKKLSGYLDFAKNRLQQVKDELGQVGVALRAAGDSGTQSLLTMEQALDKVHNAVLAYHEKQDLLTAAMTRARDEQGLLEAEVKKLADAYYDAAVALKTTQTGTEEHAKALETKLKAEADYVAAVKQLQQHHLQQQSEQYADEEKELQQHLEQQLLDLEQSLELEWITQAEFHHRKAQAEQDLAQAVVGMRREAADQSKQIYGEDSHEYRQARAAMVDAEMALQRAVRTTKQRWEEMLGISSAGTRSGKQLAAALDEVGEAGKRAGDDAAGGLSRIGREATSAKSKVDALNRSLVNSKDGGKDTGTAGGKTAADTGPGVAQWFAGEWNAITKGIQKFGSLDELAQYENKYRKEIYAVKASDSWFSGALRKHTADMVRRQRDQLRLVQQAQLQGAINTIRAQELQASGPVAQAAQGAARTVTVQFRAPDGRTVSGQFADGEAGRLLDMLRQSAAVTG